jgi:hypothetical protein
MYLSISSGVGRSMIAFDRADVHHVAHRRRGTAVARDRLARHRVGDVVLAEAAVLLGDGEAEEAVLAEQLEVAAREQELVVGALRVRAHLLLAELDERRAELLLAVGIDPVGIPVVAEPPERLASPHLLGHAHLHRIGVLAVILGSAVICGNRYASSLAPARRERRVRVARQAVLGKLVPVRRVGREMCAVRRSPVGGSSVPAAIPVRSASAACQKRLEPHSPAERASGMAIALRARDPAQRLAADDEVVVHRRGERADVAAPAPALDAVAEDDVAEQSSHLVRHRAAQAAAGRARLGVCHGAS